MFKYLMEEGEGSPSKLTSHGSLFLHSPSSPCHSASFFRTQLDTAFYISPFLSELGTCISIGVASSEPGCRGAPNRTGENMGPPNPICHKDPSGNKGEEGSLSSASPGEPQQVCKEPGELCHQVESPTSGPPVPRCPTNR